MIRSGKRLERRLKRRFGLKRELRYKLMDAERVIETGGGMTVDISSGGVSFTAEHELKPDAFVELSISWPVLLDDTCPMRLIAFGRVLRSGGGRIAATIEKYEFRTQARSFASGNLPRRNDGRLERWVEEVNKGALRASMQHV